MQNQCEPEQSIGARAWAALRVVVMIHPEVTEPMVLPGPDGARVLLAGSEAVAEQVLSELSRGALPGASSLTAA